MAKKPWKVVCLRCHEEADARWIVPGSDGIEVLVYVLSIPLLLVPGLLLSAYRSAQAYWACDVCGCREIVPVGTRRAQEIRGRGGDRLRAS